MSCLPIKDLLIKFDVSTPAAFFKSDFVAELNKSNRTFILFYYEDMVQENNPFYLKISFLSIKLLK